MQSQNVVVKYQIKCKMQGFSIIYLDDLYCLSKIYSSMFLQCTSLSKPSTIYPQQSKILGDSETFSQSNDDFVFSDFFIRKHPKITELAHEDDSNKISIENKFQSIDNTSRSEYDKTSERNLKYVLLSGEKKEFEIKFVDMKNRNGLNSQMYSKNEPCQKFKDKRELIHQRKIRPNLTFTPRTSIRYFQDHRKEQYIYPSSKKLQQNHERKSLELPQYPQQSNNAIKDERQEHSLANAYKIKCLVLGRNPKEEILQKSKKFMKKLLEKKNSNKSIATSRIQSHKLDNNLSKPFGETSRLSTQYKTKKSDNIMLPFPAKQNSKRTIKLNSIFQNFRDGFAPEQVKLQPWGKNNEADLFHDNIQEQEIEFDDRRNPQAQNEKSYLMSLPGHRSTRNSTRSSIRKIYQNKQALTLKGTILSEK